PAQVEEMCRQIPGVYLANINSATQVVISGTREALEDAEQALVREGALSVKRLAADSPLHCPLMSGVKEIMEKSLDGMVITAPKIPIVSHTSPELLTSMEQVRNVLCNQFTEQVLWRDAVNFMFDRGVREFIEIGPSDMLSKLVKWIQRSAAVYTASEAMGAQRGCAIPGKESISLNRAEESMDVQT
ncbi:MAG: ACP S-malonyltransferase, partial [bacterium]